jgi:DNA-binding NarL/FixJ family response regulator
VLRQELALILDNEADMTVVGQANNGNEAVALFNQLQPDIALLDIRMPVMNGVEAITIIRSKFPSACIIVLTTDDGDEEIYQGLRAGAKAYLLKDTSCDEILATIRKVWAGGKHISSPVGAKLAERMTLPELSDRVREVLQAIASGKSNQEIAAALGIAESTVKFHVNNILASWVWAIAPEQRSLLSSAVLRLCSLHPI